MGDPVDVGLSLLLPVLASSLSRVLLYILLYSLICLSHGRALTSAHWPMAVVSTGHICGASYIFIRQNGADQALIVLSCLHHMLALHPWPEAQLAHSTVDA